MVRLILQTTTKARTTTTTEVVHKIRVFHLTPLPQLKAAVAETTTQVEVSLPRRK